MTEAQKSEAVTLLGTGHDTRETATVMGISQKAILTLFGNKDFARRVEEAKSFYVTLMRCEIPIADKWHRVRSTHARVLEMEAQVKKLDEARAELEIGGTPYERISHNIYRLDNQIMAARGAVAKELGDDIQRIELNNVGEPVGTLAERLAALQANAGMGKPESDEGDGESSP